MLGELNVQQIEALLKQEVTGRIACSDAGIPYIVPVNYIYDGRQIISHSSAGKKISMMRNNPAVCFQVDEIKTIFSWKSAIVWGRFEEISDLEERERAFMALTHRIMPFANKPTDHASHGLAESEDDIGTKIDLILFRIIPVTMTGRFESV